MILRYLASEYSRFFMLFLGAFVIMILIGNVFGNLSIIIEDWEEVVNSACEQYHYSSDAPTAVASVKNDQKVPPRPACSKDFLARAFRS